MNVFLIENDDLLEKYNTIWDKVEADKKKKNLIASTSIINKFQKRKQNLMAMKLQIFMIKNS